MKRDIYKHQQRFENWKKKVKKQGIAGLSKENSTILFQYITDMEMGINVAIGSPKGSRSYIRLNALRDKLFFIMGKTESLLNQEEISKITEEKLHELFSDMRTGKIKRKDGKEYQSVGNYVKIFKAFWHWHQKVSRKAGLEVPDITLDLDTKDEKPKWVYLTEEQIKQLCNKAKFEYKILIMFLYDSGIRSPSELVNIKVSDLSPDCKKLLVREEISKTFGRNINLMLCSSLLKDYIEEKELKQEDYLFNINPQVTNRYLKRLAKKVLGSKESLAGENYDNLTMYDFRHCACCYWLPRYKSEPALKYRFGWKQTDKIHYYSEFLGMKDTISEEDLLIDVTKTEIEKRLVKTEKQNQVLKERQKISEDKLREIQMLVDNIHTSMRLKKGQLAPNPSLNPAPNPIILNRLNREVRVVEVETSPL